MAEYKIGRRNGKICAVFQGATCTTPFSRESLQTKIEEEPDSTLKEQYKKALEALGAVELIASDVEILVGVSAAIRARLVGFENQTCGADFAKACFPDIIKTLAELEPSIQEFLARLKKHEETIRGVQDRVNQLGCDLEDDVFGDAKPGDLLGPVSQ